MDNFKRGCPNCGGKEYVGIEVESWEDKLRVSPWYYSPLHLEPRICLNCGTVYVDSTTLNEINTLIKERKKHYENAQVQ